MCAAEMTKQVRSEQELVNAWTTQCNTVYQTALFVHDGMVERQVLEAEMAKLYAWMAAYGGRMFLPYESSLSFADPEMLERTLGRQHWAWLAPLVTK